VSAVETPSSPAADLHQPVLHEEVVRWLTPIPPGAWIVDGTVGLGGHAAALLEQTGDGRLLGLDRDRETLDLAARIASAAGVSRATFYRHFGSRAESEPHPVRAGAAATVISRQYLGSWDFRAFKWIAERRIFAQGDMGPGRYEDSVISLAA